MRTPPSGDEEEPWATGAKKSTCKLNDDGRAVPLGAACSPSQTGQHDISWRVHRATEQISEASHTIVLFYSNTQPRKNKMCILMIMKLYWCSREVPWMLASAAAPGRRSGEATQSPVATPICMTALE